MDFIQHTTPGRKHGPRFNRRTILIPQNYGRQHINASRWQARPYDLNRYRRVTRADWFGARTVAR